MARAARARLVLSAVACAAALLGAPARAQSYLLSKPGAPDVGPFEVSPDGRWAVYGGESLHSVDVLGGSPPHRLDGRPVRDGVLIAPDSRRVVYVVGPFGVHSVPIDGSAPPVALGLQGSPKITPDGRTVVVRGFSLAAGPIDGSAEPIEIVASNRVIGFVLTPDSRTVVYVLEGLFAGGGLVFAAALDGSSPPRQLNTNAAIAATGDDYLLITPDSRHLVYRRGAHGSVGRLFSVPLDGSRPPVQLSLGTTNVDWFSQIMPTITEDGTVVFKHDTFDSLILSVPADGSRPALPLSPGLGGISLNYQTTPDGRRVLLLFAGSFSSDEGELYAVPTDASAPPTALSAAVGGEERADFFELDPAGRRAAFLGRSSPALPYTLWTVPVDGSAPPLAVADATETPLGREFGLDFTSDGRTIVYTTVRFGPASFELEDAQLSLFAVPADGGAAPVRLDGPMVRGGSVRFTRFRPDGTTGGIVFRLAANGKRVLYLADQREDEHVELFAAPLPARGPGARPR